MNLLIPTPLSPNLPGPDPLPSLWLNLSLNLLSAKCLLQTAEPPQLLLKSVGVESVQQFAGSSLQMASACGQGA